MSPLRARMIEDMTLAGLAVGTQKIYTQAVYGLAKHYRRSPDQLDEEEVRAYLLGLRQRGVARGTFQTSQYAAMCLTIPSWRWWALFRRALRAACSGPLRGHRVSCSLQYTR
jgi:Phage integrase, N-terminal SAM-like domain